MKKLICAVAVLAVSTAARAAIINVPNDQPTIVAAVALARPNLDMIGQSCSGVEIIQPSTFPGGLVGFVWAAHQHTKDNANA